MSFANPNVDVGGLARLAEARLYRPDARYPRVVCGLAVALMAPVVIAVATSALVALGARGIAIAVPVLGAAALLAWLVHKSASVVRYGLRQHDVIVRKGVFWKKETVQPINRIQHVEQIQGPVAKRFGFFTLKVFSAGTGHVTFEIPGLDASTAAGIKQFILSFHEPDGEQEPLERFGAEQAPPERVDASPPGNDDG